MELHYKTGNVKFKLSQFLSGCHIKNPIFNGIQIDRSANVRVTNCLINEDANGIGMLASVALSGTCQGTVIRDNSVGHGKNGDIANHATGAVVEANVSIDAIQQP